MALERVGGSSIQHPVSGIEGVGGWNIGNNSATIGVLSDRAKEDRMAQTSKGTVAGVLDIIAGISGLVGGIPLLVIAIVGSGVLGTLPDPEIRPLAILPLAIFLPLALLCFFSGVIAIVGGIAAFNRRRWGLAVAGSIAAVFGFFPVGIAAVIFTILAEPEFRSAG